VGVLAIKESILRGNGFFDSRGYNLFMTHYHFHHPIEVRYGDLDPQGHLNNAKYLTYFEQARLQYLINLGLFEANQSFMEVGIILAEVCVTFLKPVNYGLPLQVGACTTRLGNKSFEMAYSLQGTNAGKEFATGLAVMVTYDYRTRATISLPEAWRDAITTFENLKN
jgi:acyl-CoA thioester hydrolase